MAHPVLYSFRRCPFAMRARLAIDVAGVPCELREVVLANKPPALLNASSKGTVPVWVGVDGQVIDQSLDIMRHVLTQGLTRADGEVYRPPTDERHADWQWVQRCDGPFKHHLDRYKYASRYAGKDDARPTSAGQQDPARAHRQAASAYVTDLDRHLRAAPFLHGLSEGWVDLAVAPFIRQFRLADAVWFDQQPWASVHAWLSAFMQSGRFARIMRKYPAWHDGEPGVPFPERD